MFTRVSVTYAYMKKTLKNRDCNHNATFLVFLLNQAFSLFNVNQHERKSRLRYHVQFLSVGDGADQNFEYKVYYIAANDFDGAFFVTS